MKNILFLPFSHPIKNQINSTLCKLQIPKINLLILRIFFSARNFLSHLVKTKFGASLLTHLNATRVKFEIAGRSERGDVPGWVLVVLMTTGLVTGIWTVAQPRLSSILKNSLDNMNSIR